MGAAALIFLIIIGSLLVLFGLIKPSIFQITSGDQSTSIIAKGDLTKTYKWITKEQYNYLLNQLDQNRKLVNCLLQILDKKDIAVEEIAIKLSKDR